jgi:hypothetical protein
MSQSPFRLINVIQPVSTNNGIGTSPSQLFGSQQLCPDNQHIPEQLSSPSRLGTPAFVSAEFSFASAYAATDVGVCQLSKSAFESPTPNSPLNIFSQEALLPFKIHGFPGTWEWSLA